jgi:NAD(P)-dependent dehydrogenase (short-subunit alcohol dehydrogenase family)
MSGSVYEYPVALITGGGRPGGIGQAIAARLLRDGFSVVVTDVEALADRPTYQTATDADIATTRTGLSELGTVVAKVLDVRDEAGVERVVAEVMEEFGRIDVLVNNAGVAIGIGPTDVLSLDDWRLNLDIMATGVFLCSRAVIEPMRSSGRGGRIVNIASQAGKTGFPLLAAYSAAKFAVIGLTQSLAQELGSDGITVNAVCPGTVDTPMLGLAGGLVEVYSDAFGLDPETYRRKVARQIPLRRFATPADIAGAVAYLVGSDGGYVTGAALNVTGGQEMH